MRYHIILINLVIILCFPASVLAGELAASFDDVLQIKGEKVTVHISAFRFSPESIGVDFSTYWKIEGKHPLGGFPARPTTRIGLFYVMWGGKRYNVPLSYYEDCFDPYLRKKLGWWDNQGGVSVRTADNGKSILVEMEASQIACCGYSILWVIDNMGRVARFVDSSIP
jgi:hypothetical protein